MRQLWLCLTLLAGGAVSLTAVPGRADDKNNADEIDKLVKQLGGARFADREKANKALEAIGVPALEALRKAAESDDPELRRRAGDLVAKLEKLELAAKVLAPRRVRLNYKDTPLKEAVEDLAKKSGYAITLDDPEGKLKDRKVTLEVGETTFWEAFDRFCDKAGLVESDQLQAVLPGGPPGGGGFP